MRICPYANSSAETLTGRLVRIETLAVEIQAAVALLAEIQAGLALLLVEEKRVVQVFPPLNEAHRHLSADLERMAPAQR